MNEPSNKTVKARIAVAAAIATIGWAGAAHAQSPYDPVDLKVVDRATGRTLPVWSHDGRLFVAGRPGARYGLRVTNRSDRRVLVVMSVDGVNILTGETAGWDQRGYIFAPHESYDVNGWRKSNSQIAAFAFAPLSQSYAARTGRPDEVGVIGIAVFNEKVWVPPPEADASASARGGFRGPDGPYARREAPPPPAPKLVPAAPPSAGSADAIAGQAGPATRAAQAEERLAEDDRSAPRDEKLGTAHGAREWSAVRIEPFERETPYPQFTRQIEYDTYAHLVAAGVIPYAEEQRHPRPFPSSPEGGYVPDPPDDP
jgi:hypothetical protein